MKKILSCVFLSFLFLIFFSIGHQTVQAEDTNETTVFRFFRHEKGGHFYTTSDVEMTGIRTEKYDEWLFEGAPYSVFNTQVENSVPVYRFWNPSEDKHLYTSSEVEKNQIETELSAAWRYEGIAYYVQETSTDTNEAVHRFWNKVTGKHLYTISNEEYKMILNTLVDEWNYEGISYYAEPLERPEFKEVNTYFAYTHIDNGFDTATDILNLSTKTQPARAVLSILDISGNTFYPDIILRTTDIFTSPEIYEKTVNSHNEIILSISNDSVYYGTTLADSDGNFCGLGLRKDDCRYRLNAQDLRTGSQRIIYEQENMFNWELSPNEEFIIIKNRNRDANSGLFTTSVKKVDIFNSYQVIDLFEKEYPSNEVLNLEDISRISNDSKNLMSVSYSWEFDNSDFHELKYIEIDLVTGALEEYSIEESVGGRLSDDPVFSPDRDSILFQYDIEEVREIFEYNIESKNIISQVNSTASFDFLSWITQDEIILSSILTDTYKIFNTQTKVISEYQPEIKEDGVAMVFSDYLIDEDSEIGTVFFVDQWPETEDYDQKIVLLEARLEEGEAYEIFLSLNTFINGLNFQLF